MKSGVIISTINKFGKIKQFCFGTLDNYVDIICGVIYKCAYMVNKKYDIPMNDIIHYMLSKINDFFEPN